MTHFGGRQIQASELAAALALVHGLRQEDLREPMNAARQLTRTSTRPIYSGMISTTYLLKGNLLYEMEKYLDTEQPFHVDGKQLAARFKVKDTHISSATGLLDLLEAVKKMPHDSTGTAFRFSYRWIHAKHPTPEPTWCKHYNLLKAIVTNWRENGQPTAPKDLSENYPFVSIQTGSAGQFSHPGVVIDKLLTNQLIRPHSKKESATYYQPTDESIEDVTRTMETRILPDRLRIRLLGEYNPYPVPVSQKQLQRLLREAEIILRIEKKPGIKGTELAKGLDISDTHAAAIRKGTQRTTTRYAPNKLREIVAYLRKQIELGKMGAKYKPHAEKLEQIAREKEEKQNEKSE